MRRILSLLLCLTLLLLTVACADPVTENPGTESETEAVQSSDVTSADGGSDVGSDTDSSVGSTSSENLSSGSSSAASEYVFDTSVSHKFIATDIKAHSLVVFDLNKCNGDFSKLTSRNCVVWEWDSDNDANCTIKPKAGLDSAKLRYSPYYKKDVVIACSSSGWVGVIDYAAKKTLWNTYLGYGPHSVEMMPNGDLAVACSGNGEPTGRVFYIPLSAGVTRPSCYVDAPEGHGVSYDPEKDLLWVLEAKDLVGYKVKNAGTANATLEKAVGQTATLLKKDNHGHALSPVTGSPGLYWVSGAAKLWQFDAKNLTVTFDYPYVAAMTSKNIKGIASFADGTAVLAIYGNGKNLTTDFSCTALRLLFFKEQSDGSLRPVVKDVQFTNREFYKVFPFSKDYQ